MGHDEVELCCSKKKYFLPFIYLLTEHTFYFLENFYSIFLIHPLTLPQKVFFFPSKLNTTGRRRTCCRRCPRRHSTSTSAVPTCRCCHGRALVAGEAATMPPRRFLRKPTDSWGACNAEAQGPLTLNPPLVVAVIANQAEMRNRRTRVERG